MERHKWKGTEDSEKIVTKLLISNCSPLPPDHWCHLLARSLWTFKCVNFKNTVNLHWGETKNNYFKSFTVPRLFKLNRMDLSPGMGCRKKGMQMLMSCKFIEGGRKTLCPRWQPTVTCESLNLDSNEIKLNFSSLAARPYWFLAPCGYEYTYPPLQKVLLDRVGLESTKTTQDRGMQLRGVEAVAQEAVLRTLQASR